MIKRKIETLDASPSFLGYGCMRFPTKDGKIDEEQSKTLLKAAYDAGVNYFDSAYVYHDQKSEGFVGEFLSDYPRDSFYVATKLPLWEVETLDDAKRIFDEQLKRLRVDYIDFYLVHDLKIDRLEKMDKLGIYEWLTELKKEGKIHNLGHSSHENIDNFKKIVAAHPWDFIMLHLNYMDLDNVKLYDHCVEKGIPVFAMEGVKGGSLAKLPDDIVGNFTDIHPDKSVSSWALRWVGSLPEIKVVLSGMSAIDQVTDNLKTFSEFEPLNDKEREAIKKVETQLRKRVNNNCTGCNYCMPCPSGVNIPWLFSMWNNLRIYDNKGHGKWEYSTVPADAKPANCTECGKCMELCPQDVDIIGDLKKLGEEFGALE